MSLGNKGRFQYMMLVVLLGIYRNVAAMRLLSNPMPDYLMTSTLLASSPVHPLIVSGHTFLMIPVLGGPFDMGDEHGDLLDRSRPVHLVELGDFSLGQFPVTQALWRAVVEALPGKIEPDPSYFKGDWRPVESVSWEDTQVFLQKLNELLPGRGFRLPTEAEWEYAARAGTNTRYAGSERLETVAWWNGNSHDETRPVGLKMPNALGLFDMSGNVWEWCEDWYEENYYQKCADNPDKKNPVNDKPGSDRVLRGGSWFNYFPRFCRVADRNFSAPTYRDYDFGFRLAAVPPSQWPGP